MVEIVVFLPDSELPVPSDPVEAQVQPGVPTEDRLTVTARALHRGHGPSSGLLCLRDGRAPYRGRGPLPGRGGPPPWPRAACGLLVLRVGRALHRGCGSLPVCWSYGSGGHSTVFAGRFRAAGPTGRASTSPWAPTASGSGEHFTVAAGRLRAPGVVGLVAGGNGSEDGVCAGMAP